MREIGGKGGWVVSVAWWQGGGMVSMAWW